MCLFSKFELDYLSYLRQAWKQERCPYLVSILQVFHSKMFTQEQKLELVNLKLKAMPHEMMVNSHHLVFILIKALNYGLDNGTRLLQEQAARQRQELDKCRTN